MFLMAGLAAVAPAMAQEQTSSISAITPKLAVQGKLATKTEVFEGAGVLPILSENSITAFSDAIALYEEITTGGGWPQVPRVKFQAGKKNKAVIILRQRLVREGYLDFDTLTQADVNVFDAPLTEAVKEFQKAHGVALTGQIDARTLAELNIPADVRLADLRENLGRIRVYLEGLGQRSILVNIPSIQLETIENGRVHARHNIIVGKLERPTPMLNSKVTDIVFNPFWNAPASIVARDIIPKFKEDPSYLEQMNIRVFDGVGGPEIDPLTVDWDTTPPDRYHFQQQPGENNALATVKVNFANSFMVYMHDTPHREIFATNARFESSGCVRVDNVREFISWILKGQDDFSDASFEMITASEQTYTMPVTSHIDVRFMYLTAWSTGEGHANFRPDIYQLNGKNFALGQPEPIEG
jgi:murein L,D-transpeptidase YcbB/YkuD